MGELVLWKPLYFTSIAMFGLSVFLLPFNSKGAVIVAISLVTLWSRIPGFIHFIFNKLALNDFFTFLVAATVGWKAGALFNAFAMLGGKMFGPNEWFPYTIRATIAGSAAAITVPLIVKYTGGVNIVAYFWYEGIMYATYYLLVILFAKEEIGLEVAILPAVVFFDFVMNGALMKLFGGTISNMMSKGINSGWPFIIFAGLILGFLYVAKNGKQLAVKLEPYWNKIKLGKKTAQENVQQAAPSEPPKIANQFKIPKEMEKHAISTHEELMRKKGLLERVIHKISGKH